jgi:son of sevenless
LAAEGQDAIAHLWYALSSLADIHVARHVDIDGISQSLEASPTSELYAQTIDQARLLVRTLEAAVQSLYDDGSALLLAAQSIRSAGLDYQSLDQDSSYKYVESLTDSSMANLRVVQETLEKLLSVGHDQADMAQGDYNGSIEWRMSRLSMVDTQFGGSLRPTSKQLQYPYEADGEQLIDMEHALMPPILKIDYSMADIDATQSSDFDSSNGTLVPSIDSISPFGNEGMQDDYCFSLVIDNLCADNDASQRFDRIPDFLGDVDNIGADPQPWFLRPNYNEKDILIFPDGGVRGGTVPALVERLTAHEQGGKFVTLIFHRNSRTL